MSIGIGPKSPNSDAANDDLASQVVRRHSESITGSSQSSSATDLSGELIDKHSQSITGRSRSNSGPLPEIKPGENTPGDVVQQVMDQANLARRQVSNLPQPAAVSTGPPVDRAHKAIGTLGSVLGIVATASSAALTGIKYLLPKIAATTQFAQAVPFVGAISGGLTIASTLMAMYAGRDPGVNMEKLKDEDDFLKEYPKLDGWFTRASGHRRLAADLLTMLTGVLAIATPFAGPAAPALGIIAFTLNLAVFALDPLRVLVPINKYVIQPAKWLMAKAGEGMHSLGEKGKAGWEKTKEFGSKVADKAGDLWDDTKVKASDFWDYMKGKSSAAADRVKAGVESGVEKVKSGAASFANWVGKKATQFGNWINPAISEGDKKDGDTTGPWSPQAWEAKRRDKWAHFTVDKAINLGATVFVNGVNTNLDEHNIRAQALADQTGQPVVGVWNASGKGHSAVGQLVDWAQSITDKLGIGDNPATKTLVGIIERHGAGIKLFGHSQGSIIISDAMSRVKKTKGVEGIKNLDVTTFGNAAATMPEGAKSYQHFVFDSDPISGSVGSTSIINQLFLGNPLGKAILKKMGLRSTLQDTYTMHSSSGFARAHGVVQDPLEKGGKVERGPDGKVITDNEDSYIEALPRFLQEKKAADAQRAKFGKYGIDSTAFLPARQAAGMAFGLARSIGNAAVDKVGSAYEHISPGIQGAQGMDGSPVGEGLDFLLRGAGNAIKGAGDMIGKGWDAAMGMNDPKRIIQRSPTGPGRDADPDQLRAGLLAAEGPGEAISGSIRDHVGGILGDNLSGARLHTGPASASAASALAANAFTIGPDVFFGAGKFHPGSAEGMGLVGHELAHVVQQTHGRVAIAGDFGFGSLEKAAQWIGELVKRLFGSKPEASVGTFHVDYVDESGGRVDYSTRVDTISGMALEEALRKINALKLPAKRIELLEVDIELDLDGMANSECATIWADAIVAAVGTQSRATTTAIPKTIQRDATDPSVGDLINNTSTPTPEPEPEAAERNAKLRERVIEAFKTDVRSRIANRIDAELNRIYIRQGAIKGQSSKKRFDDNRSAAAKASQLIALKARAKMLSDQLKVPPPEQSISDSTPPQPGNFPSDTELLGQLKQTVDQATDLIRSDPVLRGAAANNRLDRLVSSADGEADGEQEELADSVKQLKSAEKDILSPSFFNSMTAFTFHDDINVLLSGRGGGTYDYSTPQNLAWINEERQEEEAHEKRVDHALLAAQFGLLAIAIIFPPVGVAALAANAGISVYQAAGKDVTAWDTREVKRATDGLGPTVITDNQLSAAEFDAAFSSIFAGVDLFGLGLGSELKEARALNATRTGVKEAEGGAKVAGTAARDADEALAKRSTEQLEKREELMDEAAEKYKGAKRATAKAKRDVRKGMHELENGQEVSTPELTAKAEEAEAKEAEAKAKLDEVTAKYREEQLEQAKKKGIGFGMDTSRDKAGDAFRDKKWGDDSGKADYVPDPLPDNSNVNSSDPSRVAPLSVPQQSKQPDADSDASSTKVVP